MNSNELLGYIAAFCTTIAFLPQAIKTWKSKSAKDFSLPMMVLFVSGVGLWLVYGINLTNYPIIAANSITLVLASTILFHKIKYG